MQTSWSKNPNKDIFKTYNKKVSIGGKRFTIFLLHNEESVLDVGCGSGALYEEIRKGLTRFDYKGVDLTDEFIKACKEQYPEAEFEVQNMFKLKEEDESWDTVINFHAIEYAGPKFKEVIKEALRVAKKRVIIVLWKGLRQGKSIFKDMGNGIEWESHISSEDWFSVLKQLGFSYTPWIEQWTDDRKYNLFFIFDKKYKNIISAQGVDLLHKNE